MVQGPHWVWGSPGPRSTPEPHTLGEDGVVAVGRGRAGHPRSPGNRWEELTVMAIYRSGPEDPSQATSMGGGEPRPNTGPLLCLNRDGSGQGAGVHVGPHPGSPGGGQVGPVAGGPAAHRRGLVGPSPGWSLGSYRPAGAGLGTGLGAGLPAWLQGRESLGEVLRGPGRLSSSGRKPGWRRACLVRWSLRVKRLEQSGQGKRFSPVCVRWWRASSSERANFLSHPGQSQAKGRSPVREQTSGQWRLKDRESSSSTPKGPRGAPRPSFRRPFGYQRSTFGPAHCPTLRHFIFSEGRGSSLSH